MRKILFFFALILPPLLSTGQNQVSGFISMKFISGKTYQATIYDYTIGDSVNSGNCGTLGDFDTIRIYWGDGTSDVLSRSNGVIDPKGYPGGTGVCPCHKVGIYTGLHQFPGPGSYHVWADLGDRLYNIINIPGSGNTPMIVYNTINVDQLFQNNDSLPVITNNSVCSNACVGECYYLNLNTYSPVNDSLSYSLGTNYAPGYFIPANAVIDPVKGTLEWCSPPQQGLYDFLIQVATYVPITISGKIIYRMMDTVKVELVVLVQLTCPMSVNEITKTGGYYVYPNPAVDVVTINSSNEGVKQITFHNIVGQTIFTTTEKEQQFTINTSSLSAGIYFVTIKEEDTGRSYTLKLIKENSPR